MAVDGGGYAGRDFPELSEAAEVVETNVVAVLRGRAQACHPPRITLLLHHVPAVERISPALARRAEEVWGYSRDDLGIAISIEPEQLRMHPDVGAVVINEDRDVAHDADRTLGAIVAQGTPLLRESELQDTAHHQIVGHVAPYLVERGRFAMRQFARPLIPVGEFVMRAQAIEEHEIFQPLRILLAETLEAGAGISLHGLGKVAGGLRQQWHFARKYGGVFYGPVGFGQLRDQRAVDPAVLRQTLEADQERIAGECRRGGIRRIAVA